MNEWVMWHMWMSDVTLLNGSCDAYEWGTRATDLVVFLCQPVFAIWYVCVCVWRDDQMCVCVCVPWRPGTRKRTLHAAFQMFHDASDAFMYYLTMHSYVSLDSFTCVTWRIHMCDMTHSYAWHDTGICETWRIHMCDMTYSYIWWMWRKIGLNLHEWFMCHVPKSHVTHMNESCLSNRAVNIVISLHNFDQYKCIHIYIYIYIYIYI